MDADRIKSQVKATLSEVGYRPVSIHELATKLRIPSKARPKFFNVIHKLEKTGEISFNQAGKIIYSAADANSGVVEATLLSVGKNGGYAALDDKSGELFIARNNLCGAMPSDKIKARIIKRGGRLPEAVVLSVTERSFMEFTGTFRRLGKKAYIEPDGKYKDKIPVSGHETHDINDNEKVLARMKSYEGKGSSAAAQVINSYGPAASARACCEAILDRCHIRRIFTPEVIENAKAVSAKLESVDGRLDLRGLPIFTIDGASAKDLDDAVSVEKLPDGYRLGVHIADVSHYVTAGSPLDTEAFKRGTSIYYANSVIPMLPKELSNGICSLNPQEDRLTFSCFIDLDKGGTIKGSKLAKSVIRSRVKGVYDEVNQIFAGTADKAIKEKYAEVIPEIENMRGLALILRGARKRRGAFDFETDEAELVIGPDNVIVDIRRRERGEAERLIEEFMLCANEAVATYASGHKLPFVYRIHEEPNSEKLEALAAALRAAGIDARGIRSGLSPLDISHVLEKVALTPKSKALNDMVLRSMAKARYSPDCAGHFGLSLKYYCHFTSPIRRYPDLSIHRILTDMLSGGENEENVAAIQKRYQSFAASSSENSSEREITAMQVEWDCDDVYKAEYMAGHIGEQFSGVVSSIKPFGMYIMLPNTVEGMVRVENLPGGWYDFNEQTLTLSCERTGTRYSIGDTVNIIVAKADVPTGKIDFEVI